MNEVEDANIGTNIIVTATLLNTEHLFFHFNPMM